MKATFAALAALLISTIPLTSASAQSPYQYPVMPTAYGNPGYATLPMAAGSVSSAGGCANGSCSSGGCSNCAKPTLFGKLGLTSTGGCDSGNCGSGGNLCSKCKGWLCKPFPSTAPVLRKPDYPLGFPTHPYARSPRDYFME